MSRFETRLASNLLLQEFGKTAHSVALILLRRGMLTYPQILSYSKLSQNDVRQSLLILIHHNVVNFMAREETVALPVLYYELVLYNVLWKLRLPRIINLVAKKLGESGSLIVTEFAVRGRISGGDLLKMNFDNSGLLEEMLSERYITSIDITATLDHYGACTLMNVGNSYSSHNMRYFKMEHKKPGAYSVKEDSSSQLPLRHLLLCPSLWTPLDICPDEPHIAKRRRIHLNDHNDDVDIGKSPIVHDTLYRLNPQRLHDDLRLETWIEFLDAKLGAAQAKCMEIMCSYALKHDLAKKQFQLDSSMLFPLDEIFQGHEGSLSKDDISSALLFLSTDPLYTCIQIHGKQVRIAFDRLKRLTRDFVIQRLMKATLPENAFRLMGAVRANQRLDERHLGAVALLQWNETRELLYKLFRKGYLQQQEVPKTSYDRGSRRAVFRTAYLWSFEEQQLISRLVCDHVKMHVNLMDRWSLEELPFHRVVSKLENHLIAKGKSSWVKDKAVCWEDLMWTAEEKAMWEKWKCGMHTMTQHHIELDKTIFVLRDM